MGTENYLPVLPSGQSGVLSCIPAVVFLASTAAFGIAAMVFPGTELPGNAVGVRKIALSCNNKPGRADKDWLADSLSLSHTAYGLQDPLAKYPYGGKLCGKPRRVDTHRPLRQNYD